MKRLYPFALILLIASCTPYRLITIEEDMATVYNDFNASQNELYLKSNEWMVNSFNDAESVIQFSDKEEATIIGKYLMYGRTTTSGMYNVTTDSRVFAIIDIRLKDNKARISIKPAAEWYYDPSGFSIYGFSSDNFKEKANELKEEFHTALKSEVIDF